MKKIVCLVSILLTFIFNQVAFASFDIGPVKLEIDAKNRNSSMQIKNNKKESTNFQIDIFKKVKIKNKVEMVKTNDIIVSPAFFVLPAGKKQLVRYSILGASDTSYKDYTASIRELTINKPSKKTNIVNFVQTFNVPIKVK